MKHGKKFNHLSRKEGHRKALLSNMATSLILHKRINTTLAKAKALRTYVEPLITRAKNDSTHNRRIVFGYLKHKEPIKELFSVVAEKVADRPGGYTRIIKTGTRLGDNAETCLIELVDFNEIYMTEEKVKKTRRKRTRRSGTEKPASDNTKKPATVAKKNPKKSENIIKPDEDSEKGDTISDTSKELQKETADTKEVEQTAEKSPDEDSPVTDNIPEEIESKKSESEENPGEMNDDQPQEEKK